MLPEPLLSPDVACFSGEYGIKTRRDFIHAVQRHRAGINAKLAKRDTQVLLYHSDRFEFATRLFALALENCTVVLAVNGQNKSLIEAAEGVPFGMGEIPDSLGIETLDSVTQSTSEDEFVWPSNGHVVFMTSGSTDASKKIDKPWRFLNREVEQLKDSFDSAGQKSVLTTVSHQHIYGLLFGLLWPLYNGYLILPQVMYPEHAIPYLQQHPDLAFVSSPAFLSRLVQDNVLIPYRESIRAIYSSGGPLANDDSIQIYSQLNVAPTQVYGSTETGGIAYRQVTHEPAASWVCFSGTSVSVAEDSQQIVLSSPIIFSSPMTLDDMGVLNDDGTFYLSGRIDRTIKLEEKRVNLSQMEQRCQACELIEMCKIVLLKGQRDYLGAVIVLSEEGKRHYNAEGNRSFKKRLVAWLSDYYEHASLPRKWRIIDTMPYNEQGKLPLSVLEELFV